MNAIPPNNDDRVWRQMLEYLDGTLPDEEVRALNNRLKADAELRSVFADLLTQQIKLKELAEEAVVAADDSHDAESPVPENVVMLPTPESHHSGKTAAKLRETHLPNYGGRRRSRSVSALATAAALTLIGVAVWFWLQPARLARLTNLAGTVTIERGNRTMTAHSGDVLRVGDQVQTAANSTAEFSYLGETTDVHLDATSNLKLGLINGSKQLLLNAGAFRASVAKQKPGMPLQLRTRQAQALVVGTRFKLSTTQSSTRLEVYEGAVRILQSFEGPSMMVPAGNGVTVVPGRPAVLRRLAETRGSIFFESWDGDGATNQTYLSQFMFSGVGVTPGGSRARGYLYPPRSGAYSFEVNGTAAAELWFSDSGDANDAQKVWSNADSSAFNAELRSDKRYYLELRCVTNGTFSLSWTPPGGPQRVIYGDYLSPYDPDEEPAHR